MTRPAASLIDRPNAGWVMLVLFAGVSLWMNARSDGFLEGDGVYHYLYSRFAFEQPAYFVDVWARPLRTMIYAIPAQVADLFGVRAMALAMALATALLTRGIARDLGFQWPTLAMIFVLAQPLLLLHSVAELTEIPFALLLTIAFACYVRRAWWAFALAVSLLPLTRPEGFGFLVLAAVALVTHRRWWWLPLLVVPLLIWSYAGWVLYGRVGEWWRWIPDHWPYSSTSVYAAGPLLKFVGMLPMIVSPLVFPATLAGIAWCLAAAREAWSSPDPLERHRRVCLGLVAIVPLMILVGHSFLHWRGLMASSGESRYLLIVASFWGLLSAAGWTWIWNRFALPRPFTVAMIAACGWFAINGYWRILPLHPLADGREARRIIDWHRTPQVASQHPHLLMNHPMLVYYSRSLPPDMSRPAVLAPEPGSLFVWDPMYSLHNADSQRVLPIDLLQQHGWREIDPPASLELTTGWRFLVFEAAPPSTAPPSIPSPSTAPATQPLSDATRR
jgi:hypothetical protein